MKNVIKKIIPNGLVKNANLLTKSMAYITISLCSKSRISSSLYYLLVDRGFYREHQSVLKGKLKYYKSLKETDSNTALLRRNIHRIEKGLIMKPRRDIFGKAFISDTVTEYINKFPKNKELNDEWLWFYSVLDEYFNVVGTDETIDRAKCKYIEFKSNNKSNDNIPKTVPYPQKELGCGCISYEQVKGFIKQRRSVRWYKPQAIDIELIHKAVDLASQAPSACNRQPYKFYVVNGQKSASLIADCAMGTAGFAQNLQCVIAVVGDLSYYPEERDRHVIYIDSSLATMQLMLGLESLGLSSCAINWPDIENREQRLEKLLGLKAYERTVMLLAVGYADPEGGIPYSQKKVSNELIKVVETL